MKIRYLVVLVVSSIMIASFAFAANEASQNPHLLDSKKITATTQVVLEAESATLAGPMMVSTEGKAFNNLCINGYKVNRRGWATFTFNIPRAGEYVIWGRIKGRDGYSNSFFVSVDGAPNVVWDVSKNNCWEWDRVSDRGDGSTNYPEIDPLTFQLDVGKHTIVIGNREKETLLDQLIITDDLDHHFYTAPEAWVELDAPAMADVLAPGSTVEFKWRSQSISDKVDIDLSFDFGQTFSIPVVRGTENDGSYMVNIPAHFNRAKVVARVSDAAGGPYDTNWGFFAIVDPSLPSLTLCSPIGGETLLGDTNYLIRWKEHAFNGMVNIYWSKDQGTTWKTVAENKNAGGEYLWHVPDQPSQECLIKVADAKDGHPYDMCGATFTIKSAIVVNDEGASAGSTTFSALPTEFTLRQNYPNPFNPVTSINYGIVDEGHVTLTVYDARGRNIAVLTDGFMTPGRYQTVWDGSEFSSGVYTLVLQSGSQRLAKTMTLLK